MNSQKKFIVSHAPFWHDGTGISTKSYNIMIAALPAVLYGIFQYGYAALGVVSLSISCSILWELAFNHISKRPVSIGDGNAALIGLLFAMMLPATVPWWFVVTGTFLAVIIGKQIFGGIGANPFNPVLIAMAILMIAWKNYLDFNYMLISFSDFEYSSLYPLSLLKLTLFELIGSEEIASISNMDLFLGKQAGGIGAVFSLGLILGGLYLIIRGIIRWEISIAFLLGIFLTAMIFNQADSTKYATPVFHILTGYTLLGAFFLATEDSSSPVNFVPMIIYGLLAGVLTILIRNIGSYIDGTVFAILIANLANPLIDKIRPKALGKVD